MRSQEKEQQSYYKMLFRSDWTGNYLAFVHDVRTKIRSALMSSSNEKHVHSSAPFLTRTVLWLRQTNDNKKRVLKSQRILKKCFYLDKTKSFVAIY